jgi:hypothetical protein
MLKRRCWKYCQITHVQLKKNRSKNQLFNQIFILIQVLLSYIFFLVVEFLTGQRYFFMYFFLYPKKVLNGTCLLRIIEYFLHYSIFFFSFLNLFYNNKPNRGELLDFFFFFFIIIIYKIYFLSGV